MTRHANISTDYILQLHYYTIYRTYGLKFFTIEEITYFILIVVSCNMQDKTLCLAPLCLTRYLGNYRTYKQYIEQ